MASKVYWEGKLYIKPTAASIVNVSAMVSASFSASGTVGLIGYSDNGEPLTLHRIESTNPDLASKLFTSGDLLEGCRMVFNPSTDVNTPVGAQRIYAIPVNALTAATINNTSYWHGAFLGGTFDSLSDVTSTMTSRDYGDEANHIKRTITKTSTGIQVTVTKDSETEESGTIGTDTIMSFSQITDSNLDAIGVGFWRKNMIDYDDTGVIGDPYFKTIPAHVGFKAFAQSLNDDTAIVAMLGKKTLSNPGMNHVNAEGSLEVLSSSASDTTQTVTIYGVVLDGYEDILTTWTGTLTGVTPVDVNDENGDPIVWDTICGVKLSAACVGTVTVENVIGAAAVCTIAPASTSFGVLKFRTAGTYATGENCEWLPSPTSVGVAGFYIVRGLDADGNEALTLAEVTDASPIEASITTNGSIVKVIDYMYADLDANTMVNFLYAKDDQHGINTVYKLVSDFNSKTGRSAVTTLGNSQSFMWANVDYNNMLSELSVPSTYSDVISAAVAIKAKTYYLVDWCNTKSKFVTCERKYGNTVLWTTDGVFYNGWYLPNTMSEAYLHGASNGRADTRFADWQSALDLLQQVRISCLVPLISSTDNSPVDPEGVDVSIDPEAVYAAVLEHCQYMDGKNERNAFVGLQGDTMADIKSAIMALNVRHIALISQRVSRYSVDGVLTEFPEWSAACIAAGQQSGAVVGMPLTYKYISANGVSWENDDYEGTGWHPTYNADEMLEAGLMFLEEVEGIGWRWVKARTTYLQKDIDAYTQVAMNNAINYFVYNWRELVKNAFTGQMTVTNITEEAKTFSITKVFEPMKSLNIIVDGSSNGVRVPAYRNIKFWLTENQLYGQVTASFVNSVDFEFLTVFAAPVTMT